MIILGIETSCDETACAIVRNGVTIESTVVSSQIELHEQYGGVVPELACRRHVDILIPVLDEALKEAGLSLEDIDQIAVAKGPGLVGALLIGVNAAKALAFATGKPLIGVNHVEAHLYAAMMPAIEGVPMADSSLPPVAFPCLGVVLSGGHTALVEITGIGQYKMIGRTVDDAIGEAFDKVACILGLSYPGGPKIEVMAKSGDPHAYSLKAGRVKGRPLDFSFSGLKTNVLYIAKGQGANKHSPLLLSASDKNNLAAAFQHTAFGDVLDKISLATKLAKEEGHPYQGLVFGGGVCNNLTLRGLVRERAELPVAYWPPRGLSLDNAAMIAGLAFHLKPEEEPLHLDAETGLCF